MTTELQKQTAEIMYATPIFDAINEAVVKTIKKDVAELTNDTNHHIGLGLETPETARDADAVVKDGRLAMKIVNDVRLLYTRPIDAGKKLLMDEVKAFLHPLTEANTKLDGMLLAKERERQRLEAEARREVEEQQRAAEEAARKETERRSNISLAKGGDGDVKPVEAEKFDQPITYGPRAATQTRSIPDLEKIKAAVDSGVREIPGVKIYQVWEFTVDESKLVPEEYRKLSRR